MENHFISSLSGCFVLTLMIIKTNFFWRARRNLRLKLVFQVRTLIKKSFKTALHENDILISPAAPSAAYKIGILPVSCLPRSSFVFCSSVRHAY